MRKRILCLMLCVLLVSSMPFAVLATQETENETTEEFVPVTFLNISTAERFLTFAESCRLDSYSQNLVVTLTADIDLKSVPFEGIPVFCGTFDGSGHTISGLSIDDDGSTLGLFRYITTGATVKNLSVQGNLHPQGSRDSIGGIAGQNAGLIENCTFSGTVSASDKVGGIAGVNTVLGVIDHCQAEGNIQGDHFVGGIAGENMGVIRYSTNSAPVNTTPQQNSVELSDITLESLTNSESANTVTDVGGIAGTSGGVIRSCDNLADIGYRQMGYNIGGIAGSQMGYIIDCENMGQISGRKEVGGIVGQMEPVTSIVYTTDTLQILQQQLNTMGALTSHASATAQNSANVVTEQIAVMQEHASSAKDAVDILLPEDGTPSVPDQDQLDAARNALSSGFSGMQGSLQSISSSTQNAATALSQDLRAITAQVNAMGATISQAPENIGGTIADISDQDTPEDTSGKVERCRNHGAVLADINAGGIAGAIAPENDLDPDEDVEVTGETSLNFDSELRAVILGCNNTASVTATKQAGGGIAGRMALGLVKSCINTGSITGSNAEYMGGIAGQSMGFIRNCNAKARVEGKLHVGGIAGTASTVSDCRSLVQLSALEKQGAVAGYAEDRTNITGNYYCTLEKDPGAIDGISYDNCAQPLDIVSFMALDGLPASMKTFTVTFCFADGTKASQSVVLGRSLPQSAVPALPEVEGSIGTWEGLHDLSVTFDTTVQAVYTPCHTVKASETLRADGRPVLLAEGIFLPGEPISVQSADSQPVLQSRQVLTALDAIILPQHTGAITVRYLPPETTVADSLLYQDASGSWQSLSYTVDGSYYVFEAPADRFAVAAIAEIPFPWIWFAAAAGVLAFGIFVVVLVKKKRHT